MFNGEFLKVFDAINHDLLITKLYGYGYGQQALKLKSYLPNRWYRTKLNDEFSSWPELLSGVP